MHDACFPVTGEAASLAHREQYYGDETTQDADLARRADALPKEKVREDCNGKNRAADHHRKDDIGRRVSQCAKQRRVARIGRKPHADAEKGLLTAEASTEPKQQEDGKKSARCIQSDERRFLI